jgi:hypothetical protein
MKRLYCTLTNTVGSLSLPLRTNGSCSADTAESSVKLHPSFRLFDHLRNAGDALLSLAHGTGTEERTTKLRSRPSLFFFCIQRYSIRVISHIYLCFFTLVIELREHAVLVPASLVSIYLWRILLRLLLENAQHLPSIALKSSQPFQLLAILTQCSAIKTLTFLLQ